MLTLETIDAMIQDLEQRIDCNDTLAHMALDNRNFDGAREFAERADEFRAKRDAIMWVCGEVAEL